jgi:hypothetical protein
VKHILKPRWTANELLYSLCGVELNEFGAARSDIAIQVVIDYYVNPAYHHHLKTVCKDCLRKVICMSKMIVSNKL